jgi:hypothetical protein
MRLFSYVVARDYGFAPNPFFGLCTLATCKPVIRRTAAVGDWIVGTGSKACGIEGHLVFVMKVAEVFTYDQYWANPRFACKKPNLRGSLKQAFGDNIYHRRGRVWIQENSHHSFPGGCPNPHNIANDTQTNRVLVGNEFIYWGGTGPAIQKRFREWTGYDICAGRGHKTKFPAKMRDAFVEWVRSMGLQGCVGVPAEWP